MWETVISQSAAVGHLRVGHASTTLDSVITRPLLSHNGQFMNKQKYFNSIKENYITHCVTKSETCSTNIITQNTY